MPVCFKLLGIMPFAVLLHSAEPSAHVTRRVESIRADPRSGKLVRNVTVVSRPVSEHVVQENLVVARPVNPVAPAEPEPASAGIDEAVSRIAAQQSLPPQLLHSVIKVESNYNPFAVSNKGALGLMQLIPSTARRFGVSNVFNPVENIQGGAKYLRYLLDLYEGDYPLALAAYNAGEGAVARYHGVPPYRETQTYLQLVKRQLEKTKPVPAVQSAPTVVEDKPAGPPRIVQIVEPDGSVRYVSQ